MKTKLVFEFNSMEEATVFLGKNIGVAPAVREVPPPRKYRKRGSVPANQFAAPAPAQSAAVRAEPVAADLKAAAPETAGASQVVTGAPVEDRKANPPPVAAAPVSYEKIKPFMQQIMEKFGIDAIKAVNARFGVHRAMEVLPADSARFFQYVQDVAAGKIDPVKGAA